MTSFEISENFPVSSIELYNYWLNSDHHSAMTGGEAICNSTEGASLTAWDGYISGTNKKLIEGKEIVQSWRTAEFKDSDHDSLLVLRFTDTDEGCKLTLIHTNIPGNQPDYKQGWVEYYFEPMLEYFGRD